MVAAAKKRKKKCTEYTLKHRNLVAVVISLYKTKKPVKNLPILH